MKACAACGRPFIGARPETRFCSQSCVGRGRRRPTLEERFWKHVTKGAADACWPWSPAHPQTGYGRMTWKDGRQHSAHRIAFLMAFGWLLPDGVVMHKCDNPSCCNPSHLVMGTVSDNNKDRASKGRSCQGQRHHSAKLTPDDVRAIRASNESHSALSRRFGVHVGNIAAIRNYKKWRSVA